MPTVLFVCTANVSRSPIASALFERKLTQAGFKEQWNVASAGTWARDGSPAARKSQKLLAKMGMNIRRHRSRTVTLPLLQAADLILTMEQGQKEALRVEFPGIAGRVYMLSEMAGVVQDIRDPFGGSLIDFQDAFREIGSFIDRGFEKIVQLAQNPDSGRDG